MSMLFVESLNFTNYFYCTTKKYALYFDFLSSGLTCEHTKWKTQARMSDSPVPQGDVITGKYPIPSQVHSTLLSSSKGTGKTTPYLVIPFPFPVSIRKKVL
jgi:hypothetical protein